MDTESPHDFDRCQHTTVQKAAVAEGNDVPYHTERSTSSSHDHSHHKQCTSEGTHPSQRSNNSTDPEFAAKEPIVPEQTPHIMTRKLGHTCPHKQPATSNTSSNTDPSVPARSSDGQLACPAPSVGEDADPAVVLLRRQDQSQPVASLENVQPPGTVARLVAQVGAWHQHAGTVCRHHRGHC